MAGIAQQMSQMSQMSGAGMVDSGLRMQLSGTCP